MPVSLQIYHYSNSIKSPEPMSQIENHFTQLPIAMLNHIILEYSPTNLIELFLANIYIKIGSIGSFILTQCSSCFDR